MVTAEEFKQFFRSSIKDFLLFEETTKYPEFLDSEDAMTADFTKILEGRYPWAKEEIDSGPNHFLKNLQLRFS